MQTLTLETIRRLVRSTYVALGASAHEADVVSEVVTCADRFGIPSHGVQRLGYYVERIRAGVTIPGASITIVRETPTTAVIDGGHGIGQVIAQRAMTTAIEKARAHGLGAVAVRNSTHYGIGGYYALLAASENQIGITTTNARPAQAPTHGTQPMFGTNPLAVAAPTDDGAPFLFDAALSITQRGRIELARRRGERVPEGVAIDADGELETDPARLLARFVTGDAALLPLGGAGERLGGHKGYGLSIVMEILASTLAGGPFLTALGGGDAEGEWRPYGTGHFFLALDIAAFVDPVVFRKSTGEIVRALRASRRAPEGARIYTPGEKEHEAAARTEREGVTIGDELLDELRALRDELGLEGFDSL